MQKNQVARTFRTFLLFLQHKNFPSYELNPVQFIIFFSLPPDLCRIFFSVFVKDDEKKRIFLQGTCLCYNNQ